MIANVQAREYGWSGLFSHALQDNMNSAKASAISSHTLSPSLFNEVKCPGFTLQFIFSLFHSDGLEMALYIFYRYYKVDWKYVSRCIFQVITSIDGFESHACYSVDAMLESDR